MILLKRGAAVPILAFALGWSLPVLAVTDTYGITPQEHAACDADAVRLCSAAYPNEEKLIGCMATNRHQLSNVCQTTFASGLRKRHLSIDLPVN